MGSLADVVAASDDSLSMDSARRRLALDIAHKVTRSADRVRKASEAHARILIEQGERLVKAYRLEERVTTYIETMARLGRVKPNVFWELWRLGRAALSSDEVRADLLACETKQEMVNRLRRDVKDRAPKADYSEPVVTAVVGDNADLISRIASLYARAGCRVADVTWGRGSFWRGIDTKQWDFVRSDLVTVKGAQHDFRRLPRDKYPDGSIDVLVFDPPYLDHPGHPRMEVKYRVHTVQGMRPKAITSLYREGLREAFRVVRVGGTVWCKCQDEVDSNRQHWGHIEIYQQALELGFEAQDLFVLVAERPPYMKWPRQIHARKNHSYMWVFRKARDASSLRRVS